MSSPTQPHQTPVAPLTSDEPAPSTSFEEYCRLCAMQCPTTELHDFSASNEDSNRLFATIQQINIDIQQGDHLPQTACNECILLLKGVEEIIKKITNAQKTLMDVFKDGGLVEVKVEYAETSFSNNEINSDSEQSNEMCELNVKKEAGSPVTFKEGSLSDSDHSTAVYESESDSNDEEIQNYTEPQETLIGQITTSAINLKHKNLSTSTPITQTQKEKEQKQKDVHSMLQYIIPTIMPTTIPVTIPKTAPTTSAEKRAPIVSTDRMIPTWSDYFCCKRCNYRPKTLQDLRTHSWSTHKLCPVFKCILCPKPMVNYKRFFGHMRTQHFRALEQCCEFCNGCFMSSSDVHIHKQLKHADEAKPHKCNSCGTTFDLAEQLQSHRESFLILGSKEPRKRFKCTECTKVFLNKGTLHRHMLDHDPAKYICPICNKKLKNKACLREHVSLIHNSDSLRLWICQICGKNFKKESILKTHLARHDGVLRYSCNICEKKFSTSTNLRMHQVTHSDVRLYVCSVCGQSYKFPGGLKLHMQTHTGVRPHSCDVCDKTFNDWSNYNKHMKRIHQTDMSKRSTYNLLNN